MGIATAERIAELERDPRLQRGADGRARVNFRVGAESGPHQYQPRDFERYAAELDQHAKSLRSAGDDVGADRFELQVAFERAEHSGSVWSRELHSTTNPQSQERYRGRLLDAESRGDAAQQGLAAFDAAHNTDFHVERELKAREAREAAEQAERERRIKMDSEREQARPLYERLTPEQRGGYLAARKEFNRALDSLSPRQNAVAYLDRHPQRAREFDERFAQAVGLSTAERREARDAEVVREAIAKPAPEVHAADGRRHVPQARHYERFRAESGADGSIAYIDNTSGRAAFIDHGNRVSTPGTAYEDRDVMHAALGHAASKFERLRVSGSQQYREAVVRAAVEMGVEEKISNPELQELIRTEKDAAKQRASQGATAPAPAAKADTAAERAPAADADALIKRASGYGKLAVPPGYREMAERAAASGREVSEVAREGASASALSAPAENNAQRHAQRAR